MKIGIVVHGPNIIDSGYALKIINLLKDIGEVHCRLGGTMGRTAVIDASLEKLIDISAKRLPSESVKLFLNENFDVVILLNYGKSSVTGHTFGFKVFKNSFWGDFNKNKISRKSIDFIQIERPGEADGNVIHWIGNNTNLTLKLAKSLDLNILKPEKIVEEYFKDDFYIFKKVDFNNIDNLNKIDNSLVNSKNISNNFDNSKNISSLNDNLSNHSENIEKIRNIHGVSPNENIFVNGIVIGKSKSKNLAIVSKNDKIIDILGGDIKTHGVEKLGLVDIDKAIVKTGLLRRSNPKPRILNDLDINENNIDSTDINDINGKNATDDEYFKVAFVDHAAEDIYNLKNIDLAVTIGDDTTLVASDILYRFNIPVIGITDGDLDKVVEKGYVSEGSTIIELKSGFDDIVGNSIFKNLFNSKYYLKLLIKLENNYNSENNDNNDHYNIINTDNDIININPNIDHKISSNISHHNNHNKNSKSKIFRDFEKEVFKIVNNITTEYKIINK